MSAFDPDEDERGAQRRDLHRLDDILRPHIPVDIGHRSKAYGGH